MSGRLAALRALGVGTGSVRTIAGTMEIHMELERRLAVFKKTEAAVVFQSGFTANAGTVSSIPGREDDMIISDELNHASIIDGARLSRATIKVFPHRDVDAARTITQGPANDAAKAADHGRRVQHGRRPRAPPRAVRAGGRIRLRHDGGRCPCERRVRRQSAAGPSIISGCDGRVDMQVGHAVQGDRRARRLRRRAAGR